MNTILIQEKKISEHLATAWNLYTKLKMTHPSHVKDFCDGIHKCQQIIMWRELQRMNPKKYPTIK